MLKQALKTINTEFIQTCALSQLSFVYFRPYATSFPGLLLFDGNVKKKKRPRRQVWTLRFHSRPPFECVLCVI